MTSKLFGIIVAAGMGERLGHSLPKALVKIGGKTLLQLAVQQLLKAVSFEKLCVTHPPGYLEPFREALAPEFPEVLLVEGGVSRQESVKFALAGISEFSPAAQDLVLVHDAARCLVQPDSVVRVVEKAREVGAATLALPQSDSLKVVLRGTSLVKNSVPRSDLWRIQTPQVFEFQQIYKAHQLSLEATDDASLVQQFAEVHIVSGDEQNFKVTTPWDLELASHLVEKLSL